MRCRVRRKVPGLVGVLAGAIVAAVAATASAVDSAGPLKTASADASDGGQVRAASPDASVRRIERLIRQLGHPRFTERRAAASELRQIGPEAFDLLHAATTDPDLEVAASAQYLLRQIKVRWVRGDDSPAVRRLLLNYGDLEDDARSGVVRQLSGLPGGDGLAGLCRIARFDRSPLVSRQAALAVIRPKNARPPAGRIDADTVDQELGRSTRVAATWLRQYLRQLRDPAAGVASWQPLVDDEAAQLGDRADETSAEIVLGLLWNLAELHLQLGNSDSVIAVVDRMLALDVDLVDSTQVDLLQWMTAHKSWEVLDAFLAGHQAELEKSKRPLYFAALARAAQGQVDTANRLAERAAALDPQMSLEGFWVAKEMEQQSQFEWAEREYRHVLDTQKLTTQEAILARIELASMLFDHARYAAAADTLAPLVKGIQEDAPTSQLYDEIQRFYYRRGLGLPESRTLACRYHFYLANQYHEQQDWQREREELELAIKFDRTDADVLIAMYRVPEADDAWRAAVRQRVTALCQEFQQEIDQAPSVAMLYNQWAWLVSNTEGDYQQAVRYSHRSLELNKSGDSAEASYLDTLGRCYYAVGDYEKAVLYERQAIEKVGYMQVMHRQLALFETALAEKRQGAGGEGQGAGGEGQGAGGEGQGAGGKGQGAGGEE